MVEGKVVLITGSTDGLGKETALRLARSGAVILLHGRNHQKGREVLESLRGETGSGDHQYYNADFSSLQEVAALAESISRDYQQLDILINNAGIGSGDGRREVGREGFELRFTVNYLAPFILTNNLLQLLIKSSPSRIVNVASGAQDKPVFEDLMLQENYSGKRAYGQSKLALVMFTMTLAERLAGTGVTANSLHPASMMDTKLVRESGGQPRTTVPEGADTVVYVATSPDTGNDNGNFFDHHERAEASSQAYDINARKRLFEVSEALTRKYLNS